MDHERTNTRADRRQASSPISAAPRPTKIFTTARREAFPVALPAEALDDRIAIVGTAGSGKTYAAKGFVERLLETRRAGRDRRSARRVVGIARERRRQRSRLSGDRVWRPSCRRADHRRDGRARSAG